MLYPEHMSLSINKHIGLFRGSLRFFSNSALRANLTISGSGDRKGEEQINYDIETGRPSVPKTSGSGLRLLVSPSLEHEKLRDSELERLRIVPTLKTFFGGNPVHEDNMNNLNALLRKYINLPTKTLQTQELQSFKPVSFEEYKERCKSGSRLKTKHHRELTGILNRLRSIDRQLMPTDVAETLREFSSSKVDLFGASEKKLQSLDTFGRAVTVGKRKTSIADVYIVKGEGHVIINGKSLTSAFPNDSDRKKVLFPFNVVSQEAKYNIFAEVRGGGVSGQVEAIMYGIAKGLVVHNPLLKSRLRKAGLMTRDNRIVERKKPGKVKARKSPTWVKR